MQTTNLSLAPIVRDFLDNDLFRRNTVGFDRMFTDMIPNLRSEGDNFPFFNIVQPAENEFVIELALAGYSKDDIDIEFKDGELTVATQIGDAEAKPADEDGSGPTYLFRSIAKRPFKRTFRLAEHIEVKGADFENGILRILMEREVPEAQKPKRIAIK